MALFLAKTLLIFTRCVHWTDFKKMRLRAVYRTIVIYSGAMCLMLVACLLESKGGERRGRGSGCADEDVDEDDVDDNAYQHQHPHHHQYRHHQHEQHQ